MKNFASQFDAYKSSDRNAVFSPFGKYALAGGTDPDAHKIASI